jgi:cell division protein FtsB
MDRNYFDQLAQELFKQKQLMDHLEAENRELRKLLADLRAGRGIVVEISGSRFSLRDSPSSRDHLAGTR